jgi:3',5'-nucleoside bisphosphate phosphatase
MNWQIDLHTHSTASDGTLSPTELVRRAGAAAVDVLALTDHDSVAGVAEATSAADAVGLSLIPGVEVSVTWEASTVHIVGLGVDTGNAALQAGLAGLQRFRAWRAEEIGRRLARVGIPSAYERAHALSNGKLISRTHFARFLVESGRCRNLQAVFRNYLVSGKPGYVSGEWAALNDAIAWIRGAGGQAVIAHPARYKMSRSKLRRLVGAFKDAGGDAIEVVSGSHDRSDYPAMARLARDFALLASAGSDYHGPENPWISLGRVPRLPPDCQPVWHDWPLIRGAAAR